jgi:GDSL-like Lipase/Acylhydrolase family
MALPPLRRRVARLLLLAVSAGFGLLFAELAVRLIRPQAVMVVSRGLYEPDPPRRYRLHPGFRGTVTNRVEFDNPIAINQMGLRGGEIGSKAPGTLRVLALGDSFTFGVGAQAGETYPAQLEKILRARGTRTRAEVLNAGAPGFGVPDEVAWYERWGKPLQPDVVLIQVFLANDLQDAAPGPKVEVRDGALVVQGEKSRSVSRWLYYHSHLFVLLKNSSLGGPLRRLLGLPEPLEQRELRAEMDLYKKGELPESARVGAAATERAVTDLARDAGRVRLQAVILPSVLQVDPVRWRAALERFGLDPAKYDPYRPNRVFGDIFSRHGIPVVDLTPTFREAQARGETIYYPIDQHLTPAGYKLTAETVAYVLP